MATKQTKAERLAALRALQEQVAAGQITDGAEVVDAVSRIRDATRGTPLTAEQREIIDATIAAASGEFTPIRVEEVEAPAPMTLGDAMNAITAAFCPPLPSLADAQDRLQEIRKSASFHLPEREGPVDGICTALIARQNVILIGPPGTGKSLTVRLVLTALLGTATGFFQWLLGRTTKDEEILGPVSFAGLKEDQYRRVTRGKLPEATAAFLDEIFKAGSSLLNNLLTILNERLFFNDSEPVPVPLEIVVGASNEYPQDESLAALYDRFQHRYYVRYISDPTAMRKLLTYGTPKTLGCALEPGDLEVLRAAAAAMPWGDREVNTLLTIKAALEAEGHAISDRTWVSLRAAVPARAVVNGHTRVEAADWMVLGDMLWHEHTQRDAFVSIIGNAADPHGMQSAAIIDAATKAVRALPDFTLVVNGTTTLDDATNATGKVLSQLKAASANLAKVESEAGQHGAVAEARAKVNAHLATARALLAKLSDYDPMR